MKFMKKIILVGNPNVGKSLIFGKLTGKYATVSNYPGTTVDIITKANIKMNEKELLFIDTPGTNSLFPISEEEKITRDILIKENPDLIINICDMKNIEKSLLFFLELSKFKKPTILVLNMADEAKEKGIDIDTDKLSEILGTKIIKVIAIQNQGIDELKKSLLNDKINIPNIKINFDIDINNFREKIKNIIIKNNKNISKYLLEIY